MQVYDFYYQFLTIIKNFMYGGNVVPGSYEELCAVVSATFLSYLFIALPLIGVFCFCRAVLKVWR